MPWVWINNQVSPNRQGQVPVLWRSHGIAQIEELRKQGTNQARLPWVLPLYQVRGVEDLSLCAHSVPEPVRSSSQSPSSNFTLRSRYDCPQFRGGKTATLTKISQITNDRIRINIQGYLHTQLIHIYI